MTSLMNDGDIVIASILDNDMYKFTMMNAVYMLYPNANVVYKFINRDPNMTFSKSSYMLIEKLINDMSSLTVSEEQLNEFKECCPFLHPMYIDSLRNFRYNPDNVIVYYNDGKIELHVSGRWFETILWEVPLMALISYVYFKYEDTKWNFEGQEEKATSKLEKLRGLHVADFGTRRRRSYQAQETFVTIGSSYKNFVGTSNVHLALLYGTSPIGTMAHEFIMGTSALKSLRYANRDALESWSSVYDGDLGIALTDTFGTRSFFGDFTGRIAREYDGVRHDSGDPFKFTDNVIDHYQNQNIDPMSKTIVFSDGLDTDLALSLGAYCSNKIKCSFGIGTNFTNDFINTETGERSKPMNMVIKLYSVNGINVVKLSDNPIKATGDDQMVIIAKHIFFGDNIFRLCAPKLLR